MHSACAAATTQHSVPLSHPLSLSIPNPLSFLFLSLITPSYTPLSPCPHLSLSSSSCSCSSTRLSISLANEPLSLRHAANPSLPAPPPPPLPLLALLRLAPLAPLPAGALARLLPPGRWVQPPLGGPGRLLAAGLWLGGGAANAACWKLHWHENESGAAEPPCIIIWSRSNHQTAVEVRLQMRHAHLSSLHDYTFIGLGLGGGAS